MLVISAEVEYHYLCRSGPLHYVYENFVQDYSPITCGEMDSLYSIIDAFTYSSINEPLGQLLKMFEQA